MKQRRRYQSQSFRRCVLVSLVELLIACGFMHQAWSQALNRATDEQPSKSIATLLELKPGGFAQAMKSESSEQLPVSIFRLYPGERFLKYRRRAVAGGYTWFDVELAPGINRGVRLAKDRYEEREASKYVDLTAKIDINASWENGQGKLSAKRGGKQYGSQKVEVYLFYGEERLLLGQLTDSVEDISVVLPPDVPLGGSIFVGLSGPEAISLRQEVQVGRVPVTIQAPNPIEIGTLTSGKQKISILIACSEKSTITPVGKPVITFTSGITFDCSTGTQTAMKLLFDPEEWRKARQTPAEREWQLVYQTQDRRLSGKIRVPFMVVERNLLSEWMSRLFLPITLVLALAVGLAIHLPKGVSVLSVSLKRRRSMKGGKLPDPIGGATNGASGSARGADSFSHAPGLNPDLDRGRSGESKPAGDQFLQGFQHSETPRVENHLQRWIPEWQKLSKSVERLKGEMERGQSDLAELKKKLNSADTYNRTGLTASISELGSQFKNGLEMLTKGAVDHHVETRDGLLGLRTILDSRLLSAEQDRDVYRQYLVFPRAQEARETVSQIVSSLEEFLGAAVHLKRLASEISCGPLGRAPLTCSIIDGYLSGFPQMPVREHIAQLRHVPQQGICSLSEFVRGSFRGHEVTAEECEEGLTAAIFNGCIDESWDLVLIGAQKFNHLGNIVQMNVDDQIIHEKAKEELSKILDAANQALAKLNIRPLGIRLLTQLEDCLVPYVYISETHRPLADYFPNLDVASVPQGRLLVDCRRWAYLRNGRKLWNSQRAELVVDRLA